MSVDRRPARRIFLQRLGTGLGLAAGVIPLAACTPAPSPQPRTGPEVGSSLSKTPATKPGPTIESVPSPLPVKPTETLSSTTPESLNERYQRIITQEAQKRGSINPEETLLWQNAKNDWINTSNEKSVKALLTQKMDIAFRVLKSSQIPQIKDVLKKIRDLGIEFSSSSNFTEPITQLAAMTTIGETTPQGIDRIKRVIVISDSDLLSLKDPEELLLRIVNYTKQFEIAKSIEDRLLKDSELFRKMPATDKVQTLEKAMLDKKIQQFAMDAANLQEIETYLAYRSKTGRLSQGVNTEYLRVVAGYVEQKNRDPKAKSA